MRLPEGPSEVFNGRIERLDQLFGVLCRLVSNSGKAAAVDPAEPEKLLAAAEKEGVAIDTVLTTHKHW